MLTSYQYKGDRRFTYTYRERHLVAPQYLNDIFNYHQYYDRATRLAEFDQYWAYQDAASDYSGQPSGTSSEIVIYHKGGNFVAEVHFFVLPDDDINHSDPTLGASRKADARELIHDDEVYYVADRPKKPKFLESSQHREAGRRRRRIQNRSRDKREHDE